MRICAIFVLAVASALSFGACGERFTSSADATAGGSPSGGAAGRNPGSAGAGATSVGGSSTAGGGNSDSGSAGASEAGSSGAPCSNPATDCPATGTNCAEAICQDGQCATSNAAPASTCDDAGGQVCDGDGKCVQCLALTDCAVPASTCKRAACDALTHTCSVANRIRGFACKENGGIVCNGDGACVSTHCADGVQDADETDLDCGGSCGATCKAAAPQQKCKAPADCATGLCFGVPLLCQPPPACAATCSGTCLSCAVPGQVGTCSKLPMGVDDLPNFCTNAAICDGMGGCIVSQNKAHFGDVCTQDADCFNGSCGAGFCKLKNGDACAEDASCKSARCKANVCAGCVDDTDCASGKCNAGTCLVPGGSPCAVNGDCLSMQCVGKICNLSGSETCTAQNCATHFCHNGLCQTCTSSSDCPLNTACTGGTCLEPVDAYCSAAASCASKKCGPAALLTLRKCQTP